MHKPIFILVNAENVADARSQADSFIEDKLLSTDFDWHQGLTESQRWNEEYEIFDIPKDASTQDSMLFIIKMIKSSQVQIMEWITKGNKELEEKGLDDLSWSLSSFSIASGKSMGFIFDSTNWSCGSPIVDYESLKGFWETNEKSKIFLCGFDIHY